MRGGRGATAAGGVVAAGCWRGGAAGDRGGLAGVVEGEGVEPLQVPQQLLGHLLPPNTHTRP